MTWLITGGAGYIGAHVVRAMTEAGERTVVYDDLSTGVAARVPAEVPLVRGSVLDADRLARALAEHEITGVVHLAAKKQVGESVDRPLHYYRGERRGPARAAGGGDGGAGPVLPLLLLGGRVRHARRRPGHGGDPPAGRCPPTARPSWPASGLVRATGRATGMATAALRYFNVAGTAAPELADTGVFNLIPMVFERLTEGRRRGSSATTTRRPTAPVSATTSTWWTWPRPM